MGHSCQPCPLPAPFSTPNPVGPSIQEELFLLTRGALPGSGLTWAMGMLRAVLDQHPSSGFIPELLSSLSHVPHPSFPSFQSLGYIFLIILLPALSGSPSPAITPDNCEPSGGHGQQSGSSTWETAASADISLPSSPPPLPQLPHPSLSGSGERQGAGRAAGREGKGITRPNPPRRGWGRHAGVALSGEGCWQLGRCFWECSAPVSRGEIAVPEGRRLPACAALLGSCSHGHEQIPASPRKGIKWHHLALGELFPLLPTGGERVIQDGNQAMLLEQAPALAPAWRGHRHSGQAGPEVPAGPSTSREAELDTAPPCRDQNKLFLYIIISPKVAQPPPRAAFSSAKPTCKLKLSGTPSCSPLLPTWDAPNPGQSRWNNLIPASASREWGKTPGFWFLL